MYHLLNIYHFSKYAMYLHSTVLVSFNIKIEKANLYRSPEKVAMTKKAEVAKCEKKQKVAIWKRVLLYTHYFLNFSFLCLFL